MPPKKTSTKVASTEEIQPGVRKRAKTAPKAPVHAFKTLFDRTRHTLIDTIEHAVSDEDAKQLSSYLLDHGLDLLGKIGQFDPMDAKIILVNSPTDALLSAVDAFMKHTDQEFPDVIEMLIKHLHAVTPQRWN